MLVSLTAVIAVAAGTVFPSTAASAVVPQSSPVTVSQGAADSAQANIVPASLAGFKPGNIISDAVFTNKNTMTEAQIAAFIDSKVKKCRGGSDKYGPIVCLEDFRMTSVDRPADKYCTGYKGAPNESAARIIYKSAQACGLNPQVLLVMLEKEQSLITHTWPSAWRYDAALGQGCPDGGVPCNPAYVGFFHQIYGAARQMQMYMEGKYFTWYAPGKTWNLLYHPNRACGTSPVFIENKATSALYYYTPYQPNAAAIKAGYGKGDSCSSYGNRNFYNLFTDWFGPTSTSTFTVGNVTVEGGLWPGQTLRAVGSFSPEPTILTYQWYRNGAQIPGATKVDYTITRTDIGTKIDARVTAQRPGYQIASKRSTPALVKAAGVTRISGQSREQTAIEVSRTAWPTGTKTVFIATSADFADALTAASLLGRFQASLLLTPARALLPEVSQELKRLVPSRVVLMGGEGVLTQSVMKEIAAAVPGAHVERIAGADRYATSNSIVTWGGTNSNMLLATGRDFPDALSAASVGSAHNVPALLVDGARSALPESALMTIQKAGTRSITLIGGPGVISVGIESQLKLRGLTVTRLYGADRFLTNAAVNTKYYPNATSKMLLAPGNDFPDALSGSVLAAKWRAPLFLTEATCVVSGGTDFMRTRAVDSVYLIGGAGVLSEGGVAALRSCG